MYEILTNNLRHKSVHVIDFLAIISFTSPLHSQFCRFSVYQTKVNIKKTIFL